MPSVTVTNVLRNNFDTESAKMLAEVAKEKGISLCGIHRDQTMANFSYQGLTPVDVMLLASDLSQAVVTGSMTSVNVLSNGLNVDSADLLLKVKAEKPNLRTLCGLTHNETKLILRYRDLGP